MRCVAAGVSAISFLQGCQLLQLYLTLNNRKQCNQDIYSYSFWCGEHKLTIKIGAYAGEIFQNQSAKFRNFIANLEEKFRVLSNFKFEVVETPRNSENSSRHCRKFGFRKTLPINNFCASIMRSDKHPTSLRNKEHWNSRRFIPLRNTYVILCPCVNVHPRVSVPRSVFSANKHVVSVLSSTDC